MYLATRRNPDYSKDSLKSGFGTPHEQVVAFVFIHLNPEDPQTMESDPALSDGIGTYWTNFTKYGTPNGEGGA